MTSVGIDRSTWQPLTDWDHVVQSISVILLTEIGERVQRRQFGATVADLIDRPQNRENIIDLYMASAEALVARVVEGFQLGEPRFALTQLNAVPSPTGGLELQLYGDYFPNGHRGDFTTVFHGRSISIPFGDNLT